MRSFERYLYLAIIGALIILVLFKECNHGKHKCTPCPELIDTTITGDTNYVPDQKLVTDILKFPKKSQVSKLGTAKSKKTEAGTSEADQDSLKWIHAADSFAVNNLVVPDGCERQQVTDTQRLGSAGYVVIKDELYGRILQRKLSYSLVQSTAIMSASEAPKPKARWYAGIEAIGPLNLYIGGAVGYQGPKSRTLYFAGTGLQSGQQAFRIGLFTQLNRNR